MKWDDLRRSQNVDDRRGQRTSGGFNRMGGGNPLGLLLLLLRGPKWLILVVIALMLFGGGNFFGDIFNSGQGQEPQTTQTQAQKPGGQGQPTDQEADFMAAVLGSTEDFWTAQLKSEAGQAYQEPTLVYYQDLIQTSGCGLGQAQSGPFYCPPDQKIYLDLSFYRELQEQFHAPGDFAMAYVLAHEVGHHVQNQIGMMRAYEKYRQGASEREQNALSVRLELQADYFAGAWARYAEKEGLLEAGDIEEALTAAAAVGDDTIQEEMTGRVVPDSFTHGTAKQRMAWFQRGYQYGDIQHGDTFNVTLPADKTAAK